MAHDHNVAERLGCGRGLSGVDHGDPRLDRVVCITASRTARLVCQNGAFMADSPLGTVHVQVSDVERDTIVGVRQERRRR